MIGRWRRRGRGDQGDGSPDGARLPPAGPSRARRGWPAERLAVDYAGDPEASQAAIEQLLHEYTLYVEERHSICVQCPVTRAGRLVVRSMLEWKASHGDGRLDRWARAEVREYGEHVLDQLAHETSADGRLLDSLLDTPTCVRDLAYFLSDRGTPPGDDADALADVAEKVVGDLVVSRQRPASAPQRAPRAATRARHVKRRKRKAVRAARKRNRR